MSNDVVSREAAKKAVLDILRALPDWGGPRMAAVVGYEPFQLAGVFPVAACWYEGEYVLPEGRMTLGNRMVGSRHVINVYWNAMGDGDERERIEAEIVETERAILKALWEDTALDATISYLDAPDVTEVGYAEFGSAFYRVLHVPFVMAELEGESINP